MIEIRYNEKYQLYYLKVAMNELLSNVSSTEVKDIKHKIKLHIDHIKGCSFINNFALPLTFPLCLKNQIVMIDKNKTISYAFLGTITEKRKWIYKYKARDSIIKASNYGRDEKTKYIMDNEYYKTMCKSKFALTPTGDCPWSYRFFEAIMCLSIPIMEKNSDDIYMKDYHYFYDNDCHIYSESLAIENYNKLMSSKHFLHNFLDLPLLMNIINKTHCTKN